MPEALSGAEIRESSWRSSPSVSEDTVSCPSAVGMVCCFCMMASLEIAEIARHRRHRRHRVSRKPALTTKDTKEHEGQADPEFASFVLLRGLCGLGPGFGFPMTAMSAIAAIAAMTAISSYSLE